MKNPENKKPVTLQDLGFKEAECKLIEETLEQSHGLTVFSSPTGGGKTASIYAAIETLPKKTEKVISLECPIEKPLADVTQMQVKTPSEIGEYLQHMGKCDPDYIVVGEMWDAKTTRAAIQMALSGHVVIAGTQGKNCKGVLDTLINQDEAHLLSDAIKLIVHQRLCRKPCPNCKVPVEFPEKFRKYLPEHLRNEPNLHAYKGSGCKCCQETGFQGQTLVTEILPITRKIRKYILGELPWNEALPTSFISLEKAAAEKCLNGMGSLEFLEHISAEAT